MSEWQNIKTAPKDGTLIDLWHKEFGRASDHYWGLPSHSCGEAGSYCDSDWHSLRAGWVDATFNEPSWGSGDFSHWMPLPKPPVPTHNPEKEE